MPDTYTEPPRSVTRQQVIDALTTLGLDAGNVLRLNMTPSSLNVEVLGFHPDRGSWVAEHGEFPKTSVHIPIDP